MNRTFQQLAAERAAILDEQARQIEASRIRVTSTPHPFLTQEDVEAFFASETSPSHDGNYLPVGDIVRRLSTWCQMHRRQLLPPKVIEGMILLLFGERAIARLRGSRVKVLPALAWSSKGKTHG